jgi:hypothetical protein
LPQTDYPYLYYINSFTGGVCVNECPVLSRGNIVADNLTDIRTLITYAGVWQPSTGSAELPIDFVRTGNYGNSSDALACTDDLCFPNDSPSDSWTSDGVQQGFGFSYYVGDTYELLFRCYLTDKAEARILELVGADSQDLGLDVVNDAFGVWSEFYADIYTARKYVFGCGFGLSLGVSFVYIFLMRLPLILSALIWTSILATITVFFATGYYAYKLAEDWDDQDPRVQSNRSINLTRGAAIVMVCIGAALMLLGVCLRRQIQLAIGSVKEAGRAVNRMPLLLLVPVLQAAAFIIFLVVFVFYAVNLASLGEITTQDIPLDGDGTEISYRVYTFDDTIEGCAWYLLFCLFWTSNFITAVGDMIIASAVSKWYFTKDKGRLGFSPVLRSIGTTLFYHLGTCAYGSLILAVIQLVRALIAKAQKTAKKANSKIAGCVLCCCQCCFCILECCMKFLSKNGAFATENCVVSLYMVYDMFLRTTVLTTDD